MSKLPKRHFWDWFQRHQNEYLELNNKPKKEAAYWLHELDAHLRAYFKFFGFSLALPDKGNAKLTITVHGKAKHFKKVETFVATAPDMPGWSICALEDPQPVDFLLEKEMEKAGIDPREFCFALGSDDGENPAIIVYHPLYTQDHGHLFLRLAYAAVYNLLGERSFGMDVGSVELANLSCANPEDIHKLEELPAHVEWRGSSIVVDSNGKLLGMH